MLCSGNGVASFKSSAVDIFNAITGNWSTAVLSEGRAYLAATSLPNQGLAIFAGGIASMLCDFFAMIAGRLASVTGVL
jgi:hypothetical protein